MAIRKKKITTISKEVLRVSIDLAAQTFQCSEDTRESRWCQIPLACASDWSRNRAGIPPEPSSRHQPAVRSQNRGGNATSTQPLPPPIAADDLLQSRARDQQSQTWRSPSPLLRDPEFPPPLPPRGTRALAMRPGWLPLLRPVLSLYLHLRLDPHL